VLRQLKVDALTGAACDLADGVDIVCEAPLLLTFPGENERLPSPAVAAGMPRALQICFSKAARARSVGGIRRR